MYGNIQWPGDWTLPVEWKMIHLKKVGFYTKQERFYASLMVLCKCGAVVKDSESGFKLPIIFMISIPILHDNQQFTPILWMVYM